MKNKTEQINIRLSAQEKDCLYRLAAMRETTVSELVRTWIMKVSKHAGILEK